jgi:hypothetical protein
MYRAVQICIIPDNLSVQINMLYSVHVMRMYKIHKNVHSDGYSHHLKTFRIHKLQVCSLTSNYTTLQHSLKDYVVLTVFLAVNMIIYNSAFEHTWTDKLKTFSYLHTFLCSQLNAYFANKMPQCSYILNASELPDMFCNLIYVPASKA